MIGLATMKWAMPAVAVLLMLGTDQAKGPVPLIVREGNAAFSEVPDSGYIYKRFETSDVGGRLFDFSFDGMVTFDVRGKKGHVKGFIGVPRGSDVHDDAKYQVMVDGVVLVKGDNKDTSLVPFDVEITGHKSLRIGAIRGFYVLEPYWTQESTTSTGTETSTTGTQPELTGPADNATIASDTVNLRWKAVPGATTYLVQAVLTERKDGSDSVARGWSMTAKGATSYKWDLSGLPNGSYLWCVLALDDRKVIGKFSKDRIFVLDR